MIENDPAPLTDAVALREPLVIRNIAFDAETFDALKDIQRGLESCIRRNTSNAEVLKYLILNHTDARAARGESL